MGRPPASAPEALSSDAGEELIERRLRYLLLAARTVAVSFRSAVESAERHLRVSAAERRETVERWRAWALETLEGYATELERLEATEPIVEEATAEALMRYRDELDRAFEMVRTTPGDQ